MILTIAGTFLILFLDDSYSQIEAFTTSFVSTIISNFVVSIFFKDEDQDISLNVPMNDSATQTFINNGTINIYNNLCCRKDIPKKTRNQHSYDNEEEIDYLQGRTVIEYMEEAKKGNHDLAYIIHLLSQNMDIKKEEEAFLEEKYLDLPKPKSTFKSTSDSLPLLKEYEGVANELTKVISEKDVEIKKLNKHKENLNTIRRAYLSNKEEPVDVSIIDTVAIGRA